MTNRSIDEDDTDGDGSVLGPPVTARPLPRPTAPRSSAHTQDADYGSFYLDDDQTQYAQQSSPAPPAAPRGYPVSEPPAGERRSVVAPVIAGAAVLLLVGGVAAGTYWWLNRDDAGTPTQAYVDQHGNPITKEQADQAAGSGSASSSPASPSSVRFDRLPGLINGASCDAQPDHAKFGIYLPDGAQASVDCTFQQQMYAGWHDGRDAAGAASFTVVSRAPKTSGQSFPTTCTPAGGFVKCTWKRPNGQDAVAQLYAVD